MIPRDLLDDAGAVNIGDVLDILASVTTVLRLAVDHAGEYATMSDDERQGLSHLTTLVHRSFYDLDTMFESRAEELEQRCGELERKVASKDALITALRQELGEGDPAPRRRPAPAASAPAPDLTEPADPPHAAHG